MSKISPLVFDISTAPDSQLLLPVVKADYDVLRFDGSARAETWRPVGVRLETWNVGRRLRAVDLLRVSAGVLCLGRRAFDALSGYLASYAELLPLACDAGDFWALNVTHVADCLDEDRSVVMRLGRERRVAYVRRPWFHPMALPESGLFRIPQGGQVYAMQDFVDRVRDAGLTGLTFKRVWSSEEEA